MMQDHAAPLQNDRDIRARIDATRIFVIVGTAFLIVGGVLSGATANTPTRIIMWVSAYFTLVGGVAQILLGIGQSLLSKTLPSARWRLAECLLLNLGGAAVIGGVILVAQWLTNLGTIVFDAALVMFLLATRDSRPSAWLWPYRLAIAVVGISSLVGIGLSMMIVH